MEIKRTLSLDLGKKKNFIVCGDLNTLSLVMGTSSIVGNINHYGVKKRGKKWIVSIEKVKQRIAELENRKDKIEKKLEIMKQVVR